MSVSRVIVCLLSAFILNGPGISRSASQVRPCVEYSPFEADGINITSGLTAVSQAIAIGCFAVLGVALVLVVFGLRPQSRRSGPSLWLVALSTALVIGGVVIATVVDLRFNAISSIYGLEGPGGPGLFGSWSLVGLAGEAMAVAGMAGLVTTATVAILRLQSVVLGGRAPMA